MSLIRVILVLSLVLMGCAQKKKKEGEYAGFGRDSLSAETLKRYAPRPLTPELRNKIESYMDIRALSSAVIAPGGQKVFINWSVTGTNQVWRLDRPMAFPLQMTGGEDPSWVRAVSADGRWIVIVRDRMGDEFHGVYLQSTEGGPLREVFRKEKVKAAFQYFSDDSRSVYYTANDREESSNAVYRFDLKTGERETVFAEKGLWSLGDVKDARNLILVKSTGSMQDEHYHFDPVTKKLTPIIGQGEKAEFQVLFSPRADEYYVLTNHLRDFRTLYVWKKGEMKPVMKDRNANIESVRMDRKRTLLLFHVSKDGYTRPEALATKNLQPVVLPQFKDVEQVYAGSFSPDGRYISFNVETAKETSKNFVYDLAQKKLTQWALPSSPEVSTSHFVKASLEYYRAADGVQIPMFVWRTEECKSKACPVIVNFHGGPEAQFTPGFSTTINLFLEKGFTFVAPNVRGSDGYGKKWLDADNGPKRLEVITDIRDAARHIKEKWKVNEVAPRVGIYGGSYGGYSTLVGMSMFAGEYDAGVAVVGMSNLLTFLMNTAPYRRELRINEYGDPVKDKEALLKLSPVSYINDVKSPILILHGATDPRVPAGEAVQFFDQVKEKVPGSDMVLFPDEGHGVQKRGNRVLLLGYVIEFFQKHLGAPPQK